jgi:hypothetical protein
LEEEVLLNALRESYLPLAGDMRPVRGKAKAFTCATDGHGKERSIVIPQVLMDFPRPLQNEESTEITALAELPAPNNI